MCYSNFHFKITDWTRPICDCKLPSWSWKGGGRRERDSIQAYSERGWEGVLQGGGPVPIHPNPGQRLVRLLMVSGWQAAGPEEDDVAVGVAFPVSKDPRPLAQLAGTSIAMPAANGHGSSIIHRSAPGPSHREVAKLGRHYSACGNAAVILAVVLVISYLLSPYP